jgi:ABC-type polysaccharide/polyol phosphate export permease
MIVNYEFRKYLNIIFEFSKAHFKIKYKHSYLYFLWSIINPLILFGVLYFLFSKNIGSNVPNYALYVLIGVVHWNFFNIATSDGSKTFWFFMNVVKKTSTNRVSMILGVILSCFYSHIIEFIILTVIVAYAASLSLSMFFIFYIFLLELLLVTSISLVFSVLFSYFGDIEHVWKNVLFFGWFLTPIIYTKEVIPKSLYFIVDVNPLYYLITFSRDILIYGKIPNFNALFIFTLLACILFIVSYWIFNKLIKNVAERI